MAESDLAGLVDSGAAAPPIKEPQEEVRLPDPAGPAQSSIGGVSIARAEDIDFNFNMLIYGQSGAGKTVLAASAAEVPDWSPVLVVDVEGGTMSASRMGHKIDVVRVKSWNDMNMVYSDLYDGSKYKTVIIDSLTEAQKFSMGQIMRELLIEHPERDPDVPSVREWGKTIEQTRRLVRAFRDLPVNTIFTALSAEDKNQKTGLVERKPQLPGKLSGEVAGFLDIVVYMYQKVLDDEGNVTRLLLTQKTDDTVAKDRTTSLPQIIESPTMKMLSGYITGP